MCKVYWESDGRRTSGNNSATAGGMVAAQKLGMEFLTYMNIYPDSQQNGRQHGQRQQLTQHTVVQVGRDLRQMAPAVVVQTLRKRGLRALSRLMDVKRRQQQHRQEHCQQKE